MDHAGLVAAGRGSNACPRVVTGGGYPSSRLSHDRVRWHCLKLSQRFEIAARMVIGAPNNLGLIDWRSSSHIRARSRARAGHVAEHVAEQVASSEPARRQRSAYVTSQRREQGDGGGTQGQDSHSQGLLHSLFSAI